MKGPVPNHPRGDRDASIDALLRQTLRDGAADAAAGPCVDADLLAALADRALPDVEALSIEDHIAGCARCQAIAATLARVSSPLVEPRPSFWTRWQVGWLVPVAAAAALAVWVALPDRQQTEPVLESFQSRLESPPAPPEPADACEAAESGARRDTGTNAAGRSGRPADRTGTGGAQGGAGLLADGGPAARAPRRRVERGQCGQGRAHRRRR